VVITDRGRPVAKLAPMGAGVNATDDAALLDHLLRAGVVTRVSSSSLPAMLTEAPPEQPAGVSALALLLAERDEGR
jgi:antitoxin (DNA-binding transcriptional repressor) of toxin-antitoxin stability system